MHWVQLLRAVALALLMALFMPGTAQAQTDLSGLWTGQSSGNQVRLEMRSGGFVQLPAGTQNAGQKAGEFFFRDAGSGQYLYTKPDGNDVRVQVLGPDKIRVTNPDGWTDVFTRPPRPAALVLPSGPVSAADHPTSHYPELTPSDIAVCRPEFAALQADAVEFFRRKAASYSPGGKSYNRNPSAYADGDNARSYTKSANETEARDPLDLYVEGVGAAGPGGGEGQGYGNLKVANELWRSEEGLGYYQRDANASVPPRDASKLEYNLFTEASFVAADKCVARVFLTKYYEMHPRGAPADFAPAKRQAPADVRSPIMEEAWNGVGEPPKSPAPARNVGAKGRPKDRPVPHLSDDQKVLNEILRLTTPSSRKSEADARFEAALLEYEQKLAAQQKAVADYAAAQRQMAADKAAAAARASAAQQEFARQQAAYQAEQDRYARERAEYEAQLRGQPVPTGRGNENAGNASGPGGGTTVPPLQPTATLEAHNPANESSQCLDIIFNHEFEARGVSSNMQAVFRNSCPFPVDAKWCVGADRCTTGYDSIGTMRASGDQPISYVAPAGVTPLVRWAGCRMGFAYRPDFAGTLHYACK